MGPLLSEIHPAAFLTYNVEPFLPSILSAGTTKTASYPPSRDPPLYPLSLCFAWANIASDDAMRQAIVESAERITQVAVSEGQNISQAPLYGNYAIDTTPKDRIFGDNLPLLQKLKAQYDPADVMDLAGGWKFY